MTPRQTKKAYSFRDQTGSVDIIEFFTMYQEPVQPFIFDSLFRPIVEEWNDEIHQLEK